MAELDAQNRTCPLCGGGEHTVVSTRGRRGIALRTVLCDGCGHVFTNPAPSPENLARYYRDAYREDYKQIVAPKRKHIYRAGLSALNRLARLAPYLSPGARVIDIGAGGGEFTYLLTTKGFKATGLEPHAGYANFARETYGIDILSGTLETADFPHDDADAITLHHVLEHTANPLDTMEKIWSWLKPEGLCVVEVPNLASWAHAPRNRFHRAHLHTFSHWALEDTLINTGFRIEHINPPGDKNHLHVIARKASPPDTVRWRNVADDNRGLLAAHTPLTHIMSGQPLRRIRANAARPLREAWAIRALGAPSSGRELLDALFADRS